MVSELRAHYPMLPNPQYVRYTIVTNNILSFNRIDLFLSPYAIVTNFQVYKGSRKKKKKKKKIVDSPKRPLAPPPSVKRTTKNLKKEKKISSLDNPS